MSSTSKSIAKLPAAIWALGFVSLLMDVSSEIVHSLLPIYLITVMGSSASMIGLIEGIAESTALFFKVFSGVLSDYWQRRKVLAVFGYGLGALSKPLFALAPGVGFVLGARFIDRVGKGIRGAPRDALVADIAPVNQRGAAFGLRQSLDTVGAFLGPLVAIALMVLWSNDFKAVFWVAVIPGMLAVVVLIVGVREPLPNNNQDQINRRTNPISLENLKRLSTPYWWVVVLGGAFSLARFSEAFLILKAEQEGMPLAWIPLVLVTMNIVYAMSAYPTGKLADGMNHTTLLAIGLLALIVADFILALSKDIFGVFIGIAIWGLHMGMTQGLLAAMVADAAPADLRGTAFGTFNLISGLMLLMASVLAGFLWDLLGSSATFSAGIIFCVLTLLLLFGRRKGQL